METAKTDKTDVKISPFGIKFHCQIKEIETEPVEFKNEDGSIRKATRHNMIVASPWGDLLTSVYYEKPLVKGEYVDLRLDKYEKKVGKSAEYRFSVITE